MGCHASKEAGTASLLCCSTGAGCGRYTVGKVPKAFKIIPNLKNWEEVLWLTDPDLWSPHAMYEVSRRRRRSHGRRKAWKARVWSRGGAPTRPVPLCA